MVIPIKFRKASETLVNIGVTDFLQNRGILNFFAGVAIDGSGSKPVIATTSFYSNQSGASTLPVTGGALVEVDFDADSAIPLIMEGQAVVTVPLWHVRAGGASTVWTHTWVGVRKVDRDGNVKEIASGAGFSTAEVNTTSSIGRLVTHAFDIPRTKFKKTDTIRLTVHLDAANDGETVLIHDPKDREVLALNNITGETVVAQPDTRVLSAAIPVVLNL